jgi:hypothetical protein
MSEPEIVEVHVGDCDSCGQQVFAVETTHADFVIVAHDAPDGSPCPWSERALRVCPSCRKIVDVAPSGQPVPHAGPCGKPCISGDGEIGAKKRAHYPHRPLSSDCMHCAAQGL